MTDKYSDTQADIEMDVGYYSENYSNPEEPSRLEKMRSLPWSLAFSSATGVFGQLSFFGAMYVLFLNELGMSKTAIGLLVCFWSFTDAIAIFVAPMIARFGYRRIFLIFWTFRYIFIFPVFAVPYVLNMYGYGSQEILILMIFVMTTFSLCRSIGLTALLPWQQEYVPSEIRGKYTALDNLLSSLSNILAVILISYILSTSTNINRFMVLIAIGLVFGLTAVWFATRIPGGSPSKHPEMANVSLRSRFTPITDKSMLAYLIGASFVILAIYPINTFVPLFMKEQIGISSSDVALLQTGILFGGVASSFLWGWAADRYGSKPITLTGIAIIVFLPFLWLLMPRYQSWSIYVAFAIAFLQGASNMGWTIGSTRMLFVSIVPPEQRGNYMAINNSWLGIVTGFSTFFGGKILDFCKGLTGNLSFIAADPYLFLFAIGISFPILGILLIRKVEEDSAVSPVEFAGMFIQGNPILAMESALRFQFARDERSLVEMTERMGSSRSPLNVEELLEALRDPRFNVRFEAILAIARHKPDPRLTQALVNILNGNQPALSVNAAWALARMGNEEAITSLREGLNSHYRSVQDHSARALGTLGDQEVIPVLMARLENESDLGLQMAYGSALGKLKAQESIPLLMQLLYQSNDPDLRMELALSLGRILGDEHNFIRIMRNARHEPGGAAARVLMNIKKKWAHSLPALLPMLDDCIQSMTREDLTSGVYLLNLMIHAIPDSIYQESTHKILNECADRLGEFGFSRIEYPILALHVLSCE